ncbi:hypothetical protein Bca52824_017953 [Brassica carinata]|uniref:Uncharacterized protein n=1 Tax=Brassica carinata TaxID=52824 RepID=A0A8X7VP05_BRACI|nr:hypothetical protein Bca52824_017953 [Brassica carinata]
MLKEEIEEPIKQSDQESGSSGRNQLKDPGLVLGEPVHIQKEDIPGLDWPMIPGAEPIEGPRPRGADDAWVRPVDHQPRNFQGSKERGFFSKL